MASETRLRIVEFVLWVAVVAAIVVVTGVVVGVATGEGLLGAKYVLFVAGAILFGIGSLAIQPATPNGDEQWFSFDGGRQTRLEAAIQRIPPLENDALPFERRVGRGAKLFVTGMVVLAVSAVLEFGLGVRI